MSEDKIIIKSNFEATFDKGSFFNAPQIYVDGIKVFNPRPWQDDCFDLYQSTNKRHGIINAPTGSGKSMEMCHLSSVFLTSNSHKNIIAVPQKNIGSGFIGPIIFKTLNGNITWRIESQNNLCQKNMDENSKTQKLIKFLENDISNRMVDRCIVCTHQTLVRTFEYLTDNNQLELIKNLYFWIDEAHRSQYDNDYSNKIGGLINYCCQNDVAQNLRLFLVTATLFRGDRQSIIPDDKIENFEKFCLPYDRHFSENCEYLKSFRYDFVLTDRGYLDAVKKLLSNGTKKTIIYMPDVNSNLSSGDKIKETRAIIRAIAKNDSDNIDEDENGVINLTDKMGQQIRVIDLVDDESDRDKKDQYISENPDKIDVIINLRKFIEGADWPQANRIIIIGTKGSLKEIIQIMGRAFRDHLSKKDKPVEIYQIIPYVSKKIDKDKAKDSINDFMKSIYCSLLLELIINPPKPKIPLTKKGIFNGEKSNSSIGIDYFTKVTDMSESTLLTMIEDIVNDLVVYRSNNTNIERKQLELEYGKIVKERIDNTELKEFSEEFSQMVLSLLERKTKNSNIIKISYNGIDVKNISANLIKEDPYLGFLIGYTSGITTVKTLQDFRKLLDKLYENWDDNYNTIKEYITKNNSYPTFNSTIEDVRRLYSWITTQRQNYKNGQLNKERITLLEKLPIWSWAIMDAKWYESYNNAKTYIVTNNCYPYYYSKSKDVKKDVKYLEQWLTVQRRYRNKDQLDKERIDLLEKLPNWSWNVRDENWDENYNALKEYITKNNSYPSSHSNSKEIKRLGAWRNTQKGVYKEGQLDKERIDLLERLPNWSWVFDDQWSNNYNSLKEYVTENNSYPSSNSKIKKIKFLGMWIIDQRKDYKKAILSKERISLLEKLSKWTWDVFGSNWMKKLAEVKEYITKNNSYPPCSSKTKDIKFLGMWISSRRRDYKNNQLSKERIALLEKLPNWTWDAKDDSWNENYKAVKTYITKNGSYPPSTSNSKNSKEIKRLGAWSGTQRRNYKNNQISKERINLLEKLNGWKW